MSELSLPIAVPSTLPEEAPGASASRRLGTWTLVLGLGGLILSFLATLAALITGTLALVEARRARVHHGRAPGAYLPLHTGRGLAILGLVMAFLMPPLSTALILWPRWMAARRASQIRALEATQRRLGEHARDLRPAFRDASGRVDVPALLQRLVAQEGPQPNPYGAPSPLRLVNHPTTLGQFAVSEGYETFDPASRRPAPTIFIRIGVLDAADRPRELTWVVRLE